MFLSKVKIVTAVLLMSVLLAAGGTVGVLAYRAGEDKSESKQQPGSPKRDKEKPGTPQEKRLAQPGSEKKTPAPAEADKEDRIRPGDLLNIRVSGTIQDEDLNGVHLVEPSGKVALGVGYGRVLVKGLTIEEAERKIQEHLSRIVKDCAISVTLPIPKDPALERRVRDLESEVRELRFRVDELRRKIRD